LATAAVETRLGFHAVEQVNVDVARQAFALLQKLELDAPLKAPSVLTVFWLYCMDAYSAEHVARKHRCAKGTVMSRLRFIETDDQAGRIPGGGGSPAADRRWHPRQWRAGDLPAGFGQRR
jgi:hypothetical protein